MSNTALHEESASELARRIARREVSSREALEHFVERADHLDRALNAIVTRDLERARRLAAEADDAVARGEPVGPLHGVPMTVKDSFMTAGVRTTSGALELRDYVPTEDAWPAAALKRAGSRTADTDGSFNAPAATRSRAQEFQWKTFLIWPNLFAARGRGLWARI